MTGLRDSATRVRKELIMDREKSLGTPAAIIVLKHSIRKR